MAAAFPGARVEETSGLGASVRVTLGSGAPQVVEVENRLGSDPLPEPTVVGTFGDRVDPDPQGHHRHLLLSRDLVARGRGGRGGGWLIRSSVTSVSPTSSCGARIRQASVTKLLQALGVDPVEPQQHQRDGLVARGGEEGIGLTEEQRLPLLLVAHEQHRDVGADHSGPARSSLGVGPDEPLVAHPEVEPLAGHFHHVWQRTGQPADVVGVSHRPRPQTLAPAPVAGYPPAPSRGQGSVTGARPASRGRAITPGPASSVSA